MMKIVVLDGYTLNPGDNPWHDLEALGEVVVYPRTSREDLIERAKHADVLLTNKTPLGAADIAKLAQLKFISVLATGYNIVDVAAARARGIPVSNVPGYGTDSVAQHVFALLLELTNHVGAYTRSVESGAWEQCPDYCYQVQPAMELKGRTMGIVGFGRIGQQVAVLGQAFGMRIIYSARSDKKVDGVSAQRVSLPQLFAESDVVSLHCNQTAENIRFVNRELLTSMKRSSLLINTARGTLVDEVALGRALKDRVIAGAALDVLSVEPPAQGNPLIGATNCLITPHVAWSSLDARRRLMQTTVTNVRAYLAGSTQNVVNP